MGSSSDHVLDDFIGRSHGPWAARIELRISAFFFFLNNTISHNILDVKLAAWSLELVAWSLWLRLVNACIDQFN